MNIFQDYSGKSQKRNFQCEHSIVVKIAGEYEWFSIISGVVVFSSLKDYYKSFILETNYKQGFSGAIPNLELQCEHISVAKFVLILIVN